MLMVLMYVFCTALSKDDCAFIYCTIISFSPAIQCITEGSILLDLNEDFSVLTGLILVCCLL